MGVESVLLDEKKSSTYKFALMSAIIDYVIEKPNEYPQNGFHNIPIIYLAKRWLYYYYPLMVYGEEGVRQGNTQIALRRVIRDFIEKQEDKQFLFTEPETILQIKDKIESNEILDKYLVSLLIDIREKIVEQPLRYTQITSRKRKEKELIEGINVKDPSFILFGLINTSIPLSEHKDYQEIRKKSESWKGRKDESNWNDLEADETAFIQMGHYTYTELVKSRFFIKDAIIKRWIEFTIDSYLEKDAQAIYALFHGLYLHKKESERENVLMRKMRAIASEIFQPMKCIYCESEISSFALDHFIPWSKYPVDRFWNLFPTCTSCNSKKSDKIVELEEKIQQRIEDYLRVWLLYFQSNQEEFSKLGGKEVEYLEMNAPEQSIKFLIEQIRVINKNLI